MHTLELGAFDGPACQRVLDDTHVNTGVTRVLAQLRHLCNRQPPVLGRNSRDRVARNRIYLFDKCFLVFESQCHVYSWLRFSKN